jgi:hypothetical protein
MMAAQAAQKNSMLHLILCGAALQRCDGRELRTEN